MVIIVVGEVGVVAGEHENGVVEPRLVAHPLKELPEGHVGIADALVDDKTLFGEGLLIFLGHHIGMVAAGGKDSSHERLFHLRHLSGIVLQERLVPDGPRAVEIVIATKTGISIEVLTTVIILKTCGLSEGLEPHRATLGTMEEGCLIALVIQQTGDAADMVHGGWCQEEGLYEHGDAGEDGGHAVDTLTTITEGISEGDTAGDEVIDEGCVALVVTLLKGTVQGTDIFASEALDNEDDDILLIHARRRGIVRGSRAMDGVKDHLKGLFVAEVVGHHEDILADGAIEREGRVKHQCRLCRTVGILVGIADGNGAHCCGKSTSNTCHAKGNKEQERQQHGDIVLPPYIMALVQTGEAVEAVECPDDETKYKNEVDVVKGLFEEDGNQISLVGELAEDGGRGATHRITEIDGIAEVDEQCQAVDHNKQPAACLLIDDRLLAVPGQEHEHDVKAVGDEDGRGVEHQSAQKQFQHVGIGHIRREKGVVDSKIEDTRQEIDHVGQHQVVDGDAERGCQSEI